MYKIAEGKEKQSSVLRSVSQNRRIDGIIDEKGRNGGEASVYQGAQMHKSVENIMWHVKKHTWKRRQA
jgi:hypothetical protein